MNPEHKTCAQCHRTMSADDAHYRCQPCRRERDRLRKRAERARQHFTRMWARSQLGQPLPEGLREYG